MEIKKYNMLSKKGNINVIIDSGKIIILMKGINNKLKKTLINDT